MDFTHSYSNPTTFEEWKPGDDFSIDKLNAVVEYLNAINGVAAPMQLLWHYGYLSIYLLGQAGMKDGFRTTDDRPIGANIKRWEHDELVTASRLNEIVDSVSRISGVKPGVGLSHVDILDRPVDGQTQYAVSDSQSGPTLSYWYEDDVLAAAKLNEPIKILNSFSGVNPPRQFVPSINFDG